MHITKYGSKFRVSGVERKLLENIPGMKVYEDGNGVGHLDAIAIVARRMNQPKLTRRPAPVFATGGPAPLRDYQCEGVGFLVQQLGEEGGALLADDMGLGKTLQTIRTWEALGKPQMLVVAPASVRATWCKEVAKWVGATPVVVANGKQAKEIHPASQLVITSYELAGKLSDAYCPTMLVMDEAHNLRGRGAQRSRRLLDIGTCCNYRLALTGTPMWSRPRDLWMLLRILFPAYRFGSADDFDFAYCGAFINAYGGKVAKGATRSDELKERLTHVMLRRTKEEVAKDLPPVQRIVRWVEANPAATKCMQACFMGKMSAYNALHATLESKLDAAVDAACETDGRYLMFTWEKEHARELATRLMKAETPCVLITGDHSLKERNEAIKEAVARRCGIVATIDSCGAGVDGLQYVASTGIFHALDYVPIKLAQAEARLHRIGQSAPVTWVYLAMEQSMDASVVDTVVEKLDQWRRVMGADSTSRIRDDITALDIRDSEKAALAAMFAERGE